MTSSANRTSSPPGPDADLIELLSVLVQHFRAFERQCPQFELGESRWLTAEDEPADLEKGVLVIYHADCGSGEARAWVSPRRVKLKAHWEDIRGLSRHEDRFTCTLGERPTWGDLEFESLGDFAVAVVDLMRRRLTDLALSPHQRTDSPNRTPELGAGSR